MSSGFVHLRLHTEYSLLDSVVRIPELVAAVSAAGMPAVAVTDQNNLFAMVKFYREALRNGVKPLIGVDLLVREEGERAPPSRLTLLCQTPEGYRNLARLVSRAYLEGQERGIPRIERAWLTRAELPRPDRAVRRPARATSGRALVNAREADAERLLGAWLELFPGRYYLELQRLGRAVRGGLHRRGRGARARGATVPVVATNDVRFLKAEEFDSHEARVCIHDGALLADPGTRAPLLAPAVPAQRAGDGGAVRRHSRGARELGGDRAPLQPDAEARRGAPAAVSGAERRSATEQFLSARSGARAHASASPAWRSRAAGIPRAPAERARRHLPDGLRGVLPHRRGLHPLGARERRAGRAGTRLGRGLARGLQPAGSPIWTRSATTCCSSASSIPSACRCRTSTSISAWTAAIASSSTWRTSTDASASRRSSPTAPWRRRRWCATSAACSA